MPPGSTMVQSTTRWFVALLTVYSIGSPEKLNGIWRV